MRVNDLPKPRAATSVAMRITRERLRNSEKRNEKLRHEFQRTICFETTL